MTGIKALLTTVIVTALICGFGYFLWNNLGLSKIEAGLISAVLFLGIGQCASLVTKEIESRNVSEDMEDLSRSVSVLAQDVHNANQQMEKQYDELSEKLQGHERTMASQMKLLEDFLSDLKNGMGKKTGLKRRSKDSSDEIEAVIEDEVSLLEEVRNAIFIPAACRLPAAKAGTSL